MSFFYNETKAAPKRPKPAGGRNAHIPIASLQQLGCQACPRDKDESLQSPKMKPSGAKAPLVYLLGSSPSEDEDLDNNHWTDKAGDAIYKAFGRDAMRKDVRSNFIRQCRGEESLAATECCRPRIVADIEESKPLVIVTIGDEPFRWITGNTGTSLPHRGAVFNVRVGRHDAICIPILYPNFVHKKGGRNREYELALEFDTRLALDYAEAIQAAKKAPGKAYTAPFDTGVELIAGDKPNDLQRLAQALDELAREPDVGLDIETNGLRPFFLKSPKVWMVAIGTFERTIVFPLDHPEGWGTEGRRRKVWSMLGEFIMNSGRKIAHNLAMELEWFLYFFGPSVLRRTEWEDTMAMAHTLDERSGTKGLGMQTLRAFGFDVKKQSNIDVTRILEYPIERTLRYCGMDAKWTHKLYHYLKPRVKAENWEEYERKVRLAPTLVLTEAKGLPVDFKYVQKMEDHLESELERIEGKLRKLPDVARFKDRFGSFEPTNPDHVLKLMRDICDRDEVRVEDKRSGAVSFSTGAEILESIPASQVPAVPLILEHRAAAKLLSTYIRPVNRREIVCPDDRIRGKYSSMVAETGRLSSEDPNLQNFPKRKHKEIRGFIAALPGQIIGALDYGQIEFRVVGMASEDPAIVKACWTGYDVHKFWAERMVDIYPEIKDIIVEDFGIDWDELGIKTLRQESKNKWVFPQLFGSSIYSCAEALKLPEWAAEELAEEFWDEFRTVKRWQEGLVKKYEKTLYVETLGGRKRRGPLSLNQIINHPIQGTAADIVTAAMDDLSVKAEAESDPNYQPDINIHDDLTFFLPEDGHLGYIDRIAYEMCRHRFSYINVPIMVEASTGYRWHELEEIKKYRSDELYGMRNPYA